MAFNYTPSSFQHGLTGEKENGYTYSDKQRQLSDQSIVQQQQQQPTVNLLTLEQQQQLITTLLDRYHEKPVTVKHQMGNPGPAGLTCFGVTLFMLSSMNTGLFPADTSNAVLTLAFWSAGILLGLVGFADLLNNSTFGGVAYIAYSAFYLSYATLQQFVVPGWTAAGIPLSQQYHTQAQYYLTWTIVNTYFTIASARTSITVFLVFFFLEIVFLLFDGIYFLGPDAPINDALTKAAGWFGLACACSGFWGATAALVNETFGRDILPVGVIGPLAKSNNLPAPSTTESNAGFDYTHHPLPSNNAYVDKYNVV